VVAEINRLAASSTWSWRPFFLDLERTKVGKASLWDRQAWENDFVPRPADLPERKPLTPEGTTRPLDSKWLTAFLSEGGAMAEVFPGFEYRPGQVSMMKRVAQALNDSEQVILEAGTGIGKSIATCCRPLSLRWRTALLWSYPRTPSTSKQLRAKTFDLLLCWRRRKALAGPEHIVELKGRSTTSACGGGMPGVRLRDCSGKRPDSCFASALGELYFRGIEQS
jgi:hypothetical protein